MGKNTIIILCIFVVVFVLACDLGSDNRLTDAERFSREYPLIGEDNVFVYRSAAQIVNILANGTGVVFMGFKECPWCQQYAVFLHDAAQEIGLERIFYCDIRDDRNRNTENYRKIVDILSEHLQYDDEGNPRVYVPDVTIMSSGKIIGRDYETSKDTLGFTSPVEYWNGERALALKNKLANDMHKIVHPCGCDH